MKPYSELSRQELLELKGPRALDQKDILTVM